MKEVRKEKSSSADEVGGSPKADEGEKRGWEVPKSYEKAFETAAGGVGGLNVDEVGIAEGSTVKEKADSKTLRRSFSLWRLYRCRQSRFAATAYERERGDEPFEQLLERAVLGDLLCRLLLERKDSVLELLQVLQNVVVVSSRTPASASTRDAPSPSSP